MIFLQKIHPEWPLRLGLGLTYLYAGYQLFSQPVLWRSFLPVWSTEIIGGVMPIETYLRIQGVWEIAIGFLFLAWFLGKWGVQIGAAYSIVEFLFILIFTGINLITFRDIGLLGAAVTLLIIFSRKTMFNTGS